MVPAQLRSVLADQAEQQHLLLPAAAEGPRDPVLAGHPRRARLRARVGQCRGDDDPDQAPLLVPARADRVLGRAATRSSSRSRTTSSSSRSSSCRSPIRARWRSPSWRRSTAATSAAGPRARWRTESWRRSSPYRTPLRLHRARAARRGLRAVPAVLPGQVHGVEGVSASTGPRPSRHCSTARATSTTRSSTASASTTRSTASRRPSGSSARAATTAASASAARRSTSRSGPCSTTTARGPTSAPTASRCTTSPHPRGRHLVRSRAAGRPDPPASRVLDASRGPATSRAQLGHPAVDQRPGCSALLGQPDRPARADRTRARDPARRGRAADQHHRRHPGLPDRRLRPHHADGALRAARWHRAGRPGTGSGGPARSPG